MEKEAISVRVTEGNQGRIVTFELNGVGHIITKDKDGILERSSSSRAPGVDARTGGDEAFEIAKKYF